MNHDERRHCLPYLTHSDLKPLHQESGKNLVSIYLPTHPTGREQQQDPIRFKNLLTQAETKLESLKLRRPEIDALLQPASDLLNDQNFWKHLRRSLAVFVGPDFFETYRMPYALDELVVVAERFHIKPLLPGISQDQAFNILALSQNQVRLLEGDRHEVWEIELENVPTSLQEALWADDPERQLQHHTSANAAGAGRAGASVFHGHGLPDKDKKTNLLRYFQIVDREIVNLIGTQVPMVLAGVDYLLPIYREASQHSRLVGEAVEGNPDEASPADLHTAAWPLVEPLFQSDRQEAEERFQKLTGSNSSLASTKLAEIVPAAHQGRVEVLFAALGGQCWGSYDSQMHQIHLHDGYQPGDEDLVDLAVVQTLQNGGTVYVREPGDMPAKSEAAAIYRFSYDD
jgi:hypothetical protein